jgi:hypothetical protein
MDMEVKITNTGPKEIPEDIKEACHRLAALPPGERYVKLQEIVEKGFEIVILLRLDEDGVFTEPFKFLTIAEKEP